MTIGLSICVAFFFPLSSSSSPTGSLNKYEYYILSLIRSLHLNLSSVKVGDIGEQPIQNLGCPCGINSYCLKSI